MLPKFLAAAAASLGVSITPSPRTQRQRNKARIADMVTSGQVAKPSGYYDSGKPLSKRAKQRARGKAKASNK